MAMKPTKVPSGELQDFWTECRRAGYDPGEFVVTAKEDVPVHGGPIARVVGVQRTHKGNAIAHEFDGSSGQDWIGPAIDALKSGAFGAP